MRDYQPKKKSKYWLERSLYTRTLATIRDYSRMVQSVGDILTASPTRDNNGGGKSNLPTSPTENLAIRISKLEKEIHIIISSLDVVPEEYQEGVWLNVTENKKYPITGSKRTYSLYKQRYIFEVACRMGWAYSED